MATIDSNPIHSHFFRDRWQEYQENQGGWGNMLLVSDGHHNPCFRKYSWCLPRIIDQIFGVNLDLNYSASIMNRKANELLYSFRPPLDDDQQKELESLMKVMKVSHSIIGHAVDSKRQKQINVDNLSDHVSESKNCWHRSIQLFAKNQGKSAAEIALKYGSVEYAYELLKNRSDFQRIPTNLLEQLVPYAYKERNLSLLLNLIANGVDYSNIQLPPLVQLAEQAIKDCNEKGLEKLLEIGLSPDEIISNQALLLHAIELGMDRLVKSLLSRNANSKVQDRDGNNALHKAFLHCNSSLSATFLENLDPRQKNREGLTPLMLRCLKQSNTITEDKEREFLRNLFKRKQGSQEIFKCPDDLIIGHVKFSELDVDFVEAAYLLNDENVGLLLKHCLKREDLAASIKAIEEKYLKRSVQEFYLSHFSIAKEHFKTGLEQFKPAPRPANIDLDQILNLFDICNFDNPSRPDYQDPKGFYDATGAESIAQVRCMLENFINTIKSRKAYIGTPTAGSPALELFYQMIELHVSHTIKRLIEKQDREEVFQVLREYAAASNFCGGRYYLVALKQYLHTIHNVKMKPAAEFLFAIAEYRSIVFEQAILAAAPLKPNGHDRIPIDMHPYNHALREFGPKYGIPGYEAALQFDDKIGLGQYTKLRQTIEDNFVNNYTASGIILEWLVPKIIDDADFSGAFIDLLKEYLPTWWEKERFDEINKELQQADDLESAEQRDTEIERILTAHNIVKAPNQSIKSALHDERTNTFLGAMGRDGRKVVLEGLIFILENLQVITASIEWKDPHKKVVIPKQVRESSFFENIGKAFSDVGSAFSSFGKGVWKLITGASQ